MIPLIFSAVNDASENFGNLSNDLCIVFFFVVFFLSGHCQWMDFLMESFCDISKQAEEEIIF